MMTKSACVGVLILALAAAAPLAAEVHVSMSEATKAAVDKPHPEYSPIARQMRVSGEVVVEATINEKGTVDEVKVVSGNAMLTPSVVTAVKRWKFTPFQENGAPTRAIATLRFAFTL